MELAKHQFQAANSKHSLCFSQQTAEVRQLNHESTAKNAFAAQQVQLCQGRTRSNTERPVRSRKAAPQIRAGH